MPSGGWSSSAAAKPVRASEGTHLKAHRTANRGYDSIVERHIAADAGTDFVRHFHALPEADKAALGRIMGVLHTAMDRDFVPAQR